MDGNARINPYLAGNFAPVRSEDDFDLAVTGEIPARPARRPVPHRPQPAVRAARPEPPLVLRRRHGPRLLRRGRQGPLPQPLRPHAEVGAGARARPRAVRRLRQPDGHRPVGARQRRRRRQHQHRLARRQADGAGGGATSRSRWTRRRWSRAATSAPTRAASPPTRRSIPETGEMVWFAYGVGEMPLSAGMSYGVTAADGTVVRRDDFQAPFSSHGPRLHGHREPRAVPGPAADRQPAAGDERRCRLRLGAGQGRLRRA